MSLRLRAGVLSHPRLLRLRRTASDECGGTLIEFSISLSVLLTFRSC